MFNTAAVGMIAFVLMVLAVFAFLRAFQAAEPKEQLINYGTALALIGMVLVLMHLTK